MPDKASADFCCCDGCQRKPEIWDRGQTLPYLTFIQMSSWKKYCCHCIPEYAYVSIIDEDGFQAGAIFRLWCNINSDLKLEQPLYEKLNGGGVLVGTSVVDVTFRIRIRDGQCFLYVTSDALDVTEDTYGSSVVIDAEARGYPNDFCSTLSNEPHDDASRPYTELMVKGYRIRLSAADHVPIRGRDHCKDTVGRTIFDTDPIRNLCCNCNCICRCMCLTVNAPGVVISDDPTEETLSSASVACLYRNSYVFQNGVTIRLGPLSGLPNEDLLSCWTLDEEERDISTGDPIGIGTGVRVDSIGENHVGQVGTLATVPGKIDGAVEFSGNGLLMREDSPTLRFAAMSGLIALWAKPTDLSGDMTIIAKNAGNVVPGFGWKIWYSVMLSKFVFSISNGTTIFSVVSDSTVSLNGWHFIAATIDNEDKLITIRVNNEVVAEELYFGTIPITSSNFTMGGQDSVDDPEFFIGEIDQVVLYKNNIPHDSISESLWNGGLGRTCQLDDRCYLIVTSMGNLGVDPPPAVLLDDIENPCPRPTAQWTLTMPPSIHYTYTRPLFMSLRCASENRCEVDLPLCCPSGRSNFPTQLNADVVTGCAECPTFTVKLAYDGSIDTYIGYGHMCGKLIRLITGCPFNYLVMIRENCVDFGPLTRIGPAACDPILSVYEGMLAGIGCCSPLDIDSSTISVTLYE
jgi:hypothetical protein